jgi:GntR family transcriptional regulator, transcriptional repressor for pyruvate dehydrogenase complex
VSRPSLREAIGSLAAKGKLSVRHGQGVFVEADDTTRRLRDGTRHSLDLAELFAMREVLEVPATGWAAEKADKGALPGIEAAYTALTETAATKPVDWDELQRLDAAFHEAIVRAARNRFMLRTVGVLNEIMVEGMQTTLRIPGRLEKSAADHARILQAIRDRDPRRARAAARAHIRAAHAAALGRIGKGQGAPAAAESTGDAAGSANHIR